jgi:hypothetical protein
MQYNYTKQYSQPHKRRVLRHRIRQLIEQYVDISPDNIFLSKPHPLFVNQVPAILIYMENEEVELYNRAPEIYKRSVTINIDVLQRDRQDIRENTYDLDDYLDSRAYEIEFALLHERFLGFPEEEKYSWIDNVQLHDTNLMSIIFEGDQRLLSLRMHFVIDYFEDFSIYGSLDEFLRFDVEYETTNNAQARDHVEIRSE